MPVFVLISSVEQEGLQLLIPAKVQFTIRTFGPMGND